MDHMILRKDRDQICSRYKKLMNYRTLGDNEWIYNNSSYIIHLCQRIGILFNENRCHHCNEQVPAILLINNLLRSI